MKTLVPTLLTFFMLLFFTPASFAANYFWRGFVDNDWNNADNWQLGNGTIPGTPPASGDDVFIVGSTGPGGAVPVLSANVNLGTGGSSLTINQSVAAGGGVNLGGFSLTIGSLSISTGTATNGTFIVGGTSDITGGTFTSLDIETESFGSLSGATFTNATTLTKSGTSDDGTMGDGMTYQGDFTFVHTAAEGNIRFGADAANDYQGNATFTFNDVLTDALLIVAEASASTFGGNLSITSFSDTDVEVGNSSNTITIPGSMLISTTRAGVLINNIIETSNGGVNIISATSGGSFEANNCDLKSSYLVTVATINSISGTTFSNSSTSFFAGTIDNVQNSIFGTANVSGTTVFNKSGSSNDPWDGGNTFFHNVTFSRGSGTGNWRLANSSGNTFEGNVSVSNNEATGFFALSDNNSTIKGNLSLTGQGNDADGPLTLDGGPGQTISGTAEWTFPTLNINNADGVNVEPNLIITSALNLSGIITMVNGNTVFLNGNGTTLSGGANGFVNGGPIFKEGKTASNSSPSFTFHVGDDGFYAPFSYTTNNAGNSPDVTVQYIHSAPSGTPPGMIEVLSNTEQWVMNVASQTIFNTVVTLPYGVQSGLIGDDSDLRVLSSPNGSTWTDLGGAAGGGSIAAGTSEDYTAGSTFFFTLGSVNAARTPLPVELLYFKAIPQEEDVMLQWATASETNNDYFQVERSSNGADFTAVGDRVIGAGATNEPLNYDFVDTEPLAGISYYRLKQVDFDGHYEYSDVAAVQIGELTEAKLTAFPNPVQDQLQVRWQGDKNIEKLRLLDAQGRVMSLDVLINNKQAELNLQHLPAGTYYLEVLSGKDRKLERLIVH